MQQCNRLGFVGTCACLFVLIHKLTNWLMQSIGALDVAGNVAHVHVSSTAEIVGMGRSY